MGIPMDLDFKLLETGSLFISVLVTAFALQVTEFYYSKKSYSDSGSSVKPNNI